MVRFDYDVVVIGSGFGGSVSALRLTEKGYRVGVLEAGRRFADHEFAKTSWRVRDYLFAPFLGCTGILRITFLPDALVLSGAGVGGGSLVYGNTLYEPPGTFYADPQWAHITDWKEELAPYYDQAKRMLGVTTNPWPTPSDEVMREVADDLGVGHTYRPTPSASSSARTAPDPERAWPTRSSVVSVPTAAPVCTAVNASPAAATGRRTPRSRTTFTSRKPRAPPSIP